MSKEKNMHRQFILGASKDEIDDLPVEGYGSKDSRDVKPDMRKNWYGQRAPAQA